MALKVRSVSTTSGYLKAARIKLADGLTCIIGARGTCKSTLVETLRFVFNAEPDRVALLRGRAALPGTGDGASFHGLVKATLGEGTARCEVFEDEPFTIERDVQADTPRVLREGVPDAPPALLDRIEIFSQGDLQRLAEDGSRRLDLIDRPNRGKIDGLLAQRAKGVAELKEIGRKLRVTRSGIESRSAEIAVLPELRQQLKQLHARRPKLSAALASEREGFLKRKALLEKVHTLLTARQEILNRLQTATVFEKEFRQTASDLAKVGGPASRALATVFEPMADLLAQAARSADLQRETDAEPGLEKLKKSFEQLDRTYHKLEHDQQAVHEALRSEDRLQQQVTHLERATRELAELQAAEKGLLETRKRRRAEVQKIGDKIFELRHKYVDEISKTSGDTHLSLTPASDPSSYVATLDRLLSGSGVKNQREVANELGTRVPPHDLVDAVESGDTKLLIELLGRPQNTAKLVAHLADRPDLHDLEGVTFEDQLEISMLDAGEEKPIQQLSKGQRATALLPLILRPAEYPLVIDQPEDDLDNRYIYTSLVARIRELKKTRQLILVTHNANVPVLGDADLVVVMAMEGAQKVRPPVVGSVDERRAEILNLLEGGAEAFRERRERYGQLVQ